MVSAKEAQILERKVSRIAQNSRDIHTAVCMRCKVRNAVNTEYEDCRDKSDQLDELLSKYSLENQLELLKKKSWIDRKRR